jgi:adenosylcobinamide kinase/adenosylcobinamide-phosphate guanylyltransferase
MTTTLVLGGVRSGKSRYAEHLLAGRPQVSYVAPGPVPDGTDASWTERVRMHRARRPAGWDTVEGVGAALPGLVRGATAPLLVDCLGTWLTRLVDERAGWDDPAAAAAALAGPVQELVDAWREAPVDIVAVSNEVGLGVVPSTAAGGLFRDELGRLNTALSAASDRVVLVVAGRVLDLSAAPLVAP